MNNSVLCQQNKPSLAPYLPITRSERAEEQRGICPVLCYSLPEMADRAQQRFLRANLSALCFPSHL